MDKKVKLVPIYDYWGKAGILVPANDRPWPEGGIESFSEGDEEPEESGEQADGQQ